jgi:hypothetical protein
VHGVDERDPLLVGEATELPDGGLDEVEPAVGRRVAGHERLATPFERLLEDLALGAAPGDDGDAAGVRAGPREHVHLDLRAEVGPEGVGEAVDGEVALAEDRGAAGQPFGDRKVLLELREPDALRAEPRGRDLGMHVERCVNVVEADPARGHRVEGLAREREEARLVREVDGVLREQERPGLEPGDDPVAREHAGRDALHAVSAANGEPVPTALPAALDILAPVGLRVDLGERLRPVVALHVGHAEVRVELRDELREPRPHAPAR